MSDSKATTDTPPTASAGGGADASGASGMSRTEYAAATAKVPQSFFNDALVDRPSPEEFFRTPEEVDAILDSFEAHLKERTKNHLGYPYNLHFESEKLMPFLRYSVNNLGDPFVPSNYGVHSRRFEIEVLDFFADLWHIERDDYWGYTTTCGTEGNLLGVLYGREKLPDAVCYCSRDTHYSVPKAAYLYRVPLEMVRSQASGEIDYEELEEKLTKNKDKPALVTVNAGTTVKGAVDSIARVLEVLARVGYTRDRFYIHVDGALAGLIVPLTESVYSKDYAISFDLDIDSISVSGHKFLGCPMPCGVLITRKEHMKRFERDVEYLNSRDATIMGSRNGQASVAMWVALQKHKGVEGLSEAVQSCIERARYLRGLFEDAGIRCDLNPLSTTVVFERPLDETFVQRWQLACTGDIAHVVVMPSSSQKKLTRFFNEYMAARKAALDAGKSTSDLSAPVKVESAIRATGAGSE